MLRILHLDDVQADHEIVSYNLLRIDQSLEIAWVPSGTSALELMNNQQFDCIISDFQLPKMNGMEFLCSLRERGDKTPFVFLTGQGNEKLAAEAFRNGADEYYTKDEGFAHYTRMLNSIRQIVRAHRERRGRIDADEALQRSEQLYRTLFENAGDAMFIMDFTGKYIEVNPVGCNMLGHTREEIIGRSPFDFDTPESAKNIKTRLNKIINDGQAVFETEKVADDGSVINAEINARVIDYMGNKAVLSIARNITTRKVAERELLVKDRALETSIYGVVFADTEGTISYVNQAVVCMWGFEHDDEILGRSIFDFWLRDFTQEDKQDIFAALKSKGFWSNDADARRKDGSIFQVRFTSELILDENDEPICIMATIADITEHVEIQRELLLKNYVVESSSLPIVIVDTKGVITYANKALFDMSGYANTPENLIGQSARRFLAPRDDVMQMYRALTEQHSWEGELEVCKLDESVIPVFATGNAVTDEDGNQICWMCSLQDLTEQKSHDKKLTEGLIRLRNIFSNAACGIGFIDPDGNFLEVNERYSSIAGYTNEEMQLLGIAKISHPDDVEMSQSNLQRSLAGEQESYRIEKRYVHKDGHIVWVSVSVRSIRDENNKIVGAVAIVFDISDEVAVREALQRSEEKFRSLFENSNVIMYIVDGKTMQFIDANRAAQQFYGYTHDEFLSMKLTDLNIAGTGIVKENIRSAEEDKKSYFESQHRLSDGTVREINASVKPIDLPGKKSAHFVVAIDVTERNRIETQLKQNSDILREKTHALEVVNSELKSFSYSVSHDLRAPLRYVLGFSTMLKDHLAEKMDEETTDYLDRIITSCQRMNELIEGLLKLSRVSSEDLSFEEIDVSELSNEILEEFRLNDPDRHVETHILEGIKAYGDTLLIRTALTNLLANALKFTGGVEEPRIEVGHTSGDDGKPVLYVRDNGAGFDSAEKDRLFTPFQRLHSKHEFEGSGIGLATVQRIIRRHGGTIWAEGEEGKGATFYFTMPGAVIPNR